MLHENTSLPIMPFVHILHAHGLKLRQLQHWLWRSRLWGFCPDSLCSGTLQQLLRLKTLRHLQQKQHRPQRQLLLPDVVVFNVGSTAFDIISS